MDGWNTTFLLDRPIFRGYVSFREGISFEIQGKFLYGIAAIAIEAMDRIRQLQMMVGHQQLCVVRSKKSPKREHQKSHKFDHMEDILII